MPTFAAGGYTRRPITVTAASTTATATATGRTLGDWIQPMLGNATSTGGTWTITASAPVDNMRDVWDQWRSANHTTTVYQWQNEVWDRWDEDEATYAELQRERDELQQRREQRNRELLAQQQQRQEDLLVAHARALDLLDLLLTDEERALREAEQRIAVKGSDGHLYWIEMHRDTVHGNIVRTDEHACQLGRACVAPEMYANGRALPTADGWVGQYLGLKFDAANFLARANWSGSRTCRVPEAA